MGYTASGAEAGGRQGGVVNAVHAGKPTMDSSEMLQELAREVRQGTLQILAAARIVWLTWIWIIHGLHDEAKHSGEMYLLWKMCRLQQERAGSTG